MENILQEYHRKLAVYIERLKGVSPLDKLNQGFSYVADADGKTVNDVDKISVSDVLTIHVKNGKLITRVEDIVKAENLIKGAIGYDRNRGDTVVVTNLAYDRTLEFKEEDDAYFAEIKRKQTILIILAAVAIVLVGFILFRVISRELERRRRLREEELLRQQQAAREAALWEAKEDGMDVTMSVEETRRMELQENAINMAKEHPEEVALLIRTWLMEE
jgi:flagellar biosynthesis/type III secretory pathway M-ring protein FliF/YscJ